MWRAHADDVRRLALQPRRDRGILGLKLGPNALACCDIGALDLLDALSEQRGHVKLKVKACGQRCVVVAVVAARIGVGGHVATLQAVKRRAPR